MDRDWERLGRALQAARKAKGLKQEELAAALDVSRSAVQAIERGTVYAKPTPTIRAFAHAVDWTLESVDQVLAGGEPTYEASADPEAADSTTAPIPSSAQLPLRIVDELSDDGALLDTAVIEIGGDTRMVVVVKGKPNASPEEIRRNLEAWRRAQRNLRSLDDDGDDDEPPLVNEA